MIDRFIKFSIYQKGFTLGLTALLAIAGWISFQSLPIDAVPDITNVQVQINTSVTGLVPEEIEKLITYPVESSMGGIPGVSEVRSITRFGLSQVTLVFEEGTSLYLARQLVSERLQGIAGDLPNGAEPQLGPMTTGLGEVYFYALDAKKPASGEERVRQLMELRALNGWTIKPRLLTVKGVAEVNAIGGYEKAVYIKPDLKKLSQYGLHLHELVEAVEKNNRNTGGGYIQQTAEQLLIQATGFVRNIEDINAIVVKRLPSLETVTIGDVAEVGLDKELRTGAALVDGRETVMGTVLMLLGENSRTVSLAVDEKISEIQKTLPEWVELKVLYDRSDLVNDTLKTVEKNLLFGAVLVAVILLLLIGQVRVAIITALTIPLSLLTTFILMKKFGVSGNLMSLGALDFGIIIDGAVIVMDNCVRHVAGKAKALNRVLSRDEIRHEVFVATKEIRSAAGFGQFIIILVFLPIFALTGVEAKMFVPMAATFCFALAAAFVFSFSTVPVLASIFLSGQPRERSSKLMNFFETIYRPVIVVTLRFRAVVMAAGLLAALLGVILFSRLGSNFLPQLDEGSIAIQFVRPNHISIDQSVKMQELSESLLLKFPEVSHVFSRIGTAEVATDPMGPNLSDTYVLLKQRPENKSELIEEMKKQLNRLIPGQTVIFSQPIQLRFNELLEGVRADVAVKVFGENLDEISHIAGEVGEIIEKIPGAGDVDLEIKGLSPLLKINPNSEQLRKLGIAKENVLSTVEIAIGGKEAGHIYDGVMKFPIFVRLPEKDRSDIERIKSIPVGVGEHLTIPIRKVADIGIDETYADIRRESAKKRVAVLVNVRDRDTASFIQEAKQEIEANLKLPPGYFIEWGGSFKNLEKAKNRLMLVVPLALLLVFLTIYMAFRNVLQTCMIFACVPMAWIGGVLGLFFNGLDFSISAAIGFIALSGIAVLNGVVLVGYFNKLKLDGLTGDQLILEGTRMRLRPVLMTALAAVFGFLPMMLATGSGAEVQKPLASVVVGGIVSATLLTLIVLPVVYRMFEKKMKISVSKVAH